FAGEVGLSGEIRPVSRVDQRIQEAAKLGFEEIFVSSFNKNIQELSKDIKVTPVGKVEELFGKIFG
ncbi:MAG: DNA repair protein RadA, partial [Flavobacteriales bacterium]